MGKVGDRRGVDLLAEWLRAGKSEDECIEAATGLQELGGPRALKALAAAKDHPIPRVRLAVANALNALGSSDAVAIIAALAGEESTRCAALSRLVELGVAGSRDRLAALLEQGSLQGSAEVSPALALARAGDGRAVGPLLRCLEREGASDSWNRISILEALGQLGDPRALPALLPLLESGSGPIVEAAARAVGSIGGPEAIAALVKALDATDSWSLRVVAAESLGRTTGPSALEALKAAVRDDPTDAVRAAAEHSLRLLARTQRAEQAAAPAAASAGAGAAAASPTAPVGGGTTFTRGSLSRCRYWACSSCSAVFEKDDLEGKIKTLSGTGQVIITGEQTCADCNTPHSSREVYSGKFDLPRRHWSRIELELGKAVEV
jgi:HEAT repeat protein